MSLRTDSRGHICWARVGPLALSKAMNPFRVRAKLAVEYDSPAPAGPFFRDVWRLLDEKGHELSRLSGHYTWRNPLNTASMTAGGTFRVQEDGRYFLKVELDPEERVTVRNLSLEVRRNTGEISVGISLFGGLFVLSGVVLGYAAWREPLAPWPWERTGPGRSLLVRLLRTAYLTLVVLFVLFGVLLVLLAVLGKWRMPFS